MNLPRTPQRNNRQLAEWLFLFGFLGIVAVVTDVIWVGVPVMTELNRFDPERHVEAGVGRGMFALFAFVAAFGLQFVQKRQRLIERLAAERESEICSAVERLNEAQRIAQIGSWTLDLKAGELVWSDEVFRIFEIDPARFGATYESFIEVVHPEDRVIVDKTYRASLRDRTRYEITHRLLMSDGRIKWVHERCQSEFDGDGRALRSIGTVQDITARRLAEQALAASEERLRSFFDATPDTLLIVDSRGEINQCNRQVHKLLGYRPDELIGRPIELLVPEARRESHRVLRQDFISAPVARRMAEGRVTRARRKDGGEVDVEVSLGRFDTEEGVFVACGLRDIGDRLQEQEQTRQLMAANETILSHVLVGIAYLRQRRIVSCNRRLEEIFGYEPGELVGSSTEVLYDSNETYARIGVDAYQALAEGRHYNGEVMLRRKDGQVFSGILRGRAVDHSRPQDGSIWVYADITERKQAEADLRIAAAAFEAQQPTIITDTARRILRANRAFLDDTGFSADELIGQTPALFASGRHDSEFYRAMWACIHETGKWQGEIWDRRKSGEIYPKWLAISAVRNVEGMVTNYIGTHFDISERKRASEKIHDLAFYDQLTGLPNRTLLLDRLKQMRAANSRNDSLGAVLLIDLDNFKTVNDTLGHDAGDSLLKQVATRLKSCLRAGDTVARLGGDEFVVLLIDLDDGAIEAAANVEAVARKIVSGLSETYSLGGNLVRNSASIGITMFRGRFDTIDDLMKQADLAMYKAKDAGRNTFCFFDPAMELAVKARAALEHDLRLALDQKQFLLHYQPQIDLEGRLTGAEVLVRWRHPVRGMVSPGEFIPLAEETGLIQDLGHWVMKTACERLAAWAFDPEMSHLTLAVNVSVRQFSEPGFVDEVLDVLAVTGANAHRLKLELTESLLASNVQEIIAKMEALKARGVGFSLDDFGTGYSSLSYLKRLPLDQLKIDQSFVRDMLTGPNEAAIAKTVVALAHSLGLGVIAEGVETVEQKEFLAHSGCHAYQGYLFSRPLPVDEFEGYAALQMSAA